MIHQAASEEKAVADAVRQQRHTAAHVLYLLATGHSQMDAARQAKVCLRDVKQIKKGYEEGVLQKRGLHTDTAVAT